MLEFLTPFRCSVHFRDGKNNELQILWVQCPAKKGGALQCILGWIDRAVSQVGLQFSGGRRGHSATNYSALCLPVRLENGWHLPSILGCCAVDILANNTWFVFEKRTSWNMEQLKRWQFVERLLGVARQWIRDLEKQSGAFGKTWKKLRKSGFENKLKNIIWEVNKGLHCISYPKR